MNVSVISEQKAQVEQQSQLSQSGDNNELITKEIQLNSIIPIENELGRYVYSVFHSIMSLVAIYLSFRCNKNFDISSFLIALCCPYIYIIYILATRGTCGIIQGENQKI